MTTKREYAKDWQPTAPKGTWINDPFRACYGLDTEAWFPENGESHTVTKRAKLICSRCPVIEECREYAVSVPGIGGIWGGTNELDRRKIRISRGAKSPIVAA
jgi:WhiB family redox-sensing transcriptional regulator